MEQHNPRLKKLILQVVSNQLRMNDPPETKITLDRLISEGYSNQEAKELIAAVVSAHIFEMLSDEHVFDNAKYVADLERLPTLPYEK